ncbi:MULTISPECIES: pyridoxamine 5'-phosphate oxidase family protein [Haloferax]|uniref:Pyridoxamine 5'-phosphate oxidase family protein n=1 Tax=Haloferax marinum TaxID=2666143 RepID=A0A6A8G727_9EURY|nr:MULTISPECIES: pyridoxamine 5'-phosphate oxidase family protein [Haloferax]KAB1197842.1 pyridoxamine 5'-phosphate oxidase family protein [Haloferax sp. CBA1150]MRW96904.1 pyridoxamine 5'-phosphate oxidase family protein [Haloferax marinum]
MNTHRTGQEIPSEVEELLTGELVVAHLATCADGRPHSAPLWYRYEDGVVEILTTGVKLANIQKNPHVSISMEQDHDGIPEWMVTIRGTATLVEDEDEIREANTRINRKYGVDDDAWSENVLVRIDVGSVAYRTY